MGKDTKKQLELYVHIPFCVRKCEYCDFLSAPADKETIDAYVAALVKDIRMHKDMADAYLVSSIFVGGGTPSILDASQISKIFMALLDTFYIADDAEITIECNPGAVDAAKIRRYHELGINRISIGLQSTQNYELKSIGRIHTYAQFLDTYYLFRNAGFDNINIDLMSALPNQGIDSYEDTLDRVIRLKPEHISAYSLILEEGTPLKERIEKELKRGIHTLPSEEDERRMYEMTEEMLGNAGYVHYEISNYAKPGKECRHNIGYWERVPYLGLGLGASSLIEETRFKRPENLKEYIDILSKDPVDQQKLQTEIQKLSKRNQMEEFMFLGLRMMEGVDKKEFEQTFGHTLEDVYGRVIRDLVSKGLIEESRKGIRLTKRGVDVSNYVMSEFLF